MESESKRRDHPPIEQLLGNLWESATGGVLMLPTQPGADCISQGSNVQPLKPHSALLPCTDCRERRGGVGSKSQ